MPKMKHGNEQLWCRERLAKYCVGNGCDLGFGRAPINRTAICIDREEGHPDRAPTLAGDAPRTLLVMCVDLPFKDGVMDYVFSVHCLEDFEDTRRCACGVGKGNKAGGLLVLFLPDQQRYVKFCQETDELPNGAHKLPQFRT